MINSFIGLIGAICGALVTGFFALSLTGLKAKLTVQAEDNKLFQNNLTRSINHKLVELKTGFVLLSRINIFHSKTYANNSFLSDSRISYNKKWLSHCKNIDLLGAILFTSFPDIVSYYKGLPGLTNQFWGIQQDGLYQKEQGRNLENHSYWKNINEISSLIDSKVTNLRKKMEEEASSLNQILIERPYN